MFELAKLPEKFPKGAFIQIIRNDRILIEGSVAEYLSDAVVIQMANSTSTNSEVLIEQQSIKVFPHEIRAVIVKGAVKYAV